ncbi:ArsC family reductase [Shewanella sp. Choline-02u-19]|jgi:arsenate reductase|uniref:ArsC family reductase n=1 Tax=unclassified Shewanella TaxID=196818 RepID=UPI000C33D3FD|nr:MULTISPECIES: ArsC family reductase [unclassified Shewanella]PKG58369.1 ArsC family reductase [Shewanella sp. GutDb-MelDb]PKG73813.1 ArsC family reductase [Shewanella sp. GutCb]PKH56844.1 ArsC family reductase [Shewanella sp. Bg11-22]PKI27641.1 ArsC family reductase [Shewanella sp. Choline-02u-19]
MRFTNKINNGVPALTLFGIKNCDTVRKARKWLEQNNLSVDFHDFREHGLTAEQVEEWVAVVGWETLFNKRSTSFRNLTDTEKNDINEKKAIALMVLYPTLIKRPVLVNGSKVNVGFKEAEYKAWFSL